MKNTLIIFLAFCQFSCSSATTVSNEKSKLSPVEKAYLSFPEFTSVEMSPSGKYAVMAVTSGGQSRVTTYDVQKKEALGAVDPGKNFHVQNFIWVNDDKIIVVGKYSEGFLKGAEENQFIFSLSRGGKDFRRILPKASQGEQINLTHSYYGLVSKKVIDDRYLLVSERKASYSGVSISLYRLEINRGDLKFMERVPMEWGNYVVDNQNRARIAFSVSKKGKLKVFSKNTLKNSWVEQRFWSWPSRVFRVLGFEKIDSKFYFLADNQQSLQALYSAKISSRGIVSGIEEIFSYQGGDVHFVDWDEKAHRPAFAEFGNGYPERKYFPDVARNKILQALDKAFPGEKVYADQGFSGDSLITIQSDARPKTYYILRSKNQAVEEFLSSNEKVRSLPTFKSEPITFLARDGLKIEGFFHKPKNWTPKSPLIVDIHGGPFGIRESWGYSGDRQFLLNSGYAVLRINFRGSGGRGLNFERAGHKKIGLEMLDDIADGVKWAASQKLVVEGNVCLWGISYGAYASIQTIIRYPKLFQCAAAFGGVYDWSTFLDEGDSIGNPWSKNYWETKLPTSPKERLQQSPIKYVSKLSKEVLVMHGTDDVRCAVDQARRLKRQLTKFEKKHQYREFSDTGHWFVSNQEKKNATFETLKLFLDRNLKNYP